MALSNQEAARRLYQSGSASPSNYSHARHSVYDVRKTAARRRNDHIELKRLEAEEQQLVKLCSQLKLDDTQALRLANAIRDCSVSPLSRNELLENDVAHLKERYGERVAETIVAAAKHVNELLADKPVLAEVIGRTHAHIHGDAVEIACEAAEALGLVQAIAPQPAPAPTPENVPDPAPAEAA